MFVPRGQLSEAIVRSNHSVQCLTYQVLRLYSFYTSYSLYLVACTEDHQGRPPWEPPYIRHSRNRHKNLHNDHRCARAFDAGCNLQKHYGCNSREGMGQEFLSTMPRVCWWGCKSGLTLIKHEDKMIFMIQWSVILTLKWGKAFMWRYQRCERKILYYTVGSKRDFSYL